MKVLGAEDVPERGLGQHPRAVVAVLHISHRDRGVGDSEKHHRVHRHCHTVLGQNLKIRLFFKSFYRIGLWFVTEYELIIIVF